MKRIITLSAFLLGSILTGKAQTYCTPEGLNCSNADGPNYFQLTGEESTEIAYDNAECNTDAYFDYSESSGAKLYAGKDYSFDVQSGQPTQVLSVWIDLDNSGTFDDTEMIVVEQDFSDAVTTLSMSVPSTATAGTYRMRVMGVLNGTIGDLFTLEAVYPMTPCNTDGDGNPVYANGKTLDFFVEIADDPLPIDLAEFRVTNRSAGVLLEWVTHMESQNKGFYIERSPNGKDWKTIEFVPSLAEMNYESVEKLSYSYLVRTPIKGANVYRLKQVDYGGQVSYSPVRKIIWDNGKSELLQAYPNPAGKSLTIAGLDGNERIQVFNINGMRVMDRPAMSAKEQLDISSLPAGTYLVQITDIHGNTEVKKISRSND